GGEGERLGGLGPGARLHLVRVHRHRAGRHPGRARDHPLPAVLPRLHARDAAAVLVIEGQRQVRLVMEAVETLHHGLLYLLDRVHGLACVGVDLQDALVMKLDLQVLRPAAVTPQPARLGAKRLLRRSLHISIMAVAAFLAPTGCSLGGDKEPKPITGVPKEIAATVDRLESAVAGRDYETICNQLFTAQA